MVGELVFLMALVLFTAGPASAEVFQYEFESMTGHYPPCSPCPIHTRVDTFTYTGPPGQIEAVSVNILGWSHLGTMVCEGIVDPDTLGWPMNPGASFGGPGSHDRWSGGDFLSGGVFDITLELYDYSGRAVRTLSPQDDLQFSINFGPSGMVGLCSGLDVPWGVLVGVTLSITVNPAVPTEESTWGRIKALFEP